jgi:tetratricopeptide (TPR) repeat protein
LRAIALAPDYAARAISPLTDIIPAPRRASKGGIRMRAGLLIGVAACLLAALPAVAQAPSVQEQRRPAQTLREAERAQQAAQAAEKLRPLEPGDKVTYQDILKNPDNIELNYLYAQSQVAAGELRGAAATLERILLLSPGLARVRLLYAVVLFRLDNLSESEREFRSVSQLPMAESLREEVDHYLEEIANRRKVTRVAGTAGLGMQWDSNRNAGPDSGNVLFFDTPFSLVEGKKQGDFSGLMLAGVRAQHDLGYDAGHMLIGAAQLFGQKQVDVTSLDLGAFSGEAGGLYRAPWVDIQPSLFTTYLNLAGESYVTTVGTGVRASHRFSQALEVAGRFRFDYEFFENLENSPFTDQRTGGRYEGGLGLSWTPLPTLRIDAGAGFVDKQADQDYYAYVGPQAVLGTTWLLGQGQFLLSTFFFEYDDYAGPQLPFYTKTRRDAWYRGRISYGAPLGFLLPFVSPPRAVRDTILTLNVEYLNVQSTITNYQFNDWRLSFLFTKNFDF